MTCRPVGAGVSFVAPSIRVASDIENKTVTSKRLYTVVSSCPQPVDFSLHCQCLAVPFGACGAGNVHVLSKRDPDATPTWGRYPVS
jgi:hypothetical protein